LKAGGVKLILCAAHISHFPLRAPVVYPLPAPTHLCLRNWIPDQVRNDIQNAVFKFSLILNFFGLNFNGNE
jgi:hypothetical protein